jgi:hypothetical protein
MAQKTEFPVKNTRRGEKERCRQMEDETERNAYDVMFHHNHQY